MRITLDIPLTLEEILNILDSSAYISTDLHTEIKGICTDTRECKTGDIFVALNGKNDSGENYVNSAIEYGCFVICTSGINNVIKVDDTNEALLKIAMLYKKKISPKYTVAVTGSVGKSTTTFFLARILREKYKVHSTPGNFNNHIGVPITLLTMPKDTEALVVEIGMNHKNEISRLSRCINPDLAIITAIGTSHIGNLGSRENIASAKLEIFDGMKIGNVLMPVNEPLLSGIMRGLYVGRNCRNADFSLYDNADGTYCMKSKSSSTDGICFFDNREHYIDDLAFAISAAEILNLSENEIINGVKAITQSNLRQRFILLKDFTIFDDSYNASFESIIADLKFIKSLNMPTGAFLGDILELGDNSKEIHEQLGRSITQLKIDRLYLYGEYAEHTAYGALKAGMESKNIYLNTDIATPQISIAQIRNNHANGEIILFKASHGLRLDKIADFIKDEERICND